VVFPAPPFCCAIVITLDIIALPHYLDAYEQKSTIYGFAMPPILTGFSQENVSRAAQIIGEEGLVAFPTETVYGLGANAISDMAVAKIFAAKGRPSFNPLIIHFASKEDIKKEVEWNDTAEKLSVFWPGPFTMVLKRKPGCRISKLASAGLDTVAVRIPANEVAQNLIKAAGVPLAAPSANRSGKISPTSAEHVKMSLEDNVNLILDGGLTKVGIESTVVDVSTGEAVLLRPGIITIEDISAKYEVRSAQNFSNPQSPIPNLKSPGMLESHYAPDIPMRLNATDVSSTEALISFGDNEPSGAKEVFNLSKSGDLVEAAANLFTALHNFNRSEFTAIAVAPIPDEGIGIAINDRLKRAALYS
jgi:L-threonylcarbamoyladenylate synthase